MTDRSIDQEMPCDVEAEKTIIGAILLDNEAYFEAAEKLNSEDFSLDSHRRIFLRIAHLMSSSRAVDLVTLVHELSRYGEVESIGGVAYLASLTEGLPRRPVIREYISITKDKSLLRNVMAVCSMGIARAREQFDPALDVAGKVMSDLESAVNSNMQGSDMESIGQWLSKNDVFAERVPGIKTGIDEYDDLTYGLHPQELTIVAGRTSMGKTAHCSTIAWNLARRGKCVAVFVNEQRKDSFMGRMLCAAADVSFKAYREGRLSVFEKMYIEEAVADFKNLPIFWDQRSSMSVASIRARSARLKRSGELDAILVDQLSRVSREGIWEKGMRTDEVIGEKVAALKGVAVDLKVPLVLYHQVGRASVKNQDARPTLVDLAESGKIEQHADNVAFLHRPGYYNREDQSLKDKAEIFLAKQRDGETGSINCEFIGACCKWQNRRKR